VVASEIDQGRRWNEARIKALSGGDPVKARLMRQDFFEFRPQFKLLVVGNNKPSLRGVDEAMRRRLHLLPFTVTIPSAARDPGLPDKLKAEGPAILRWAIDGCLAWQREGLAPPKSVTNVTEAYLSSEDAFGLWFDECCEADAKAWTSSAELFQSWKAWTERSGERAGSQRRLSQMLETHGFQAVRRREEGRGFCGLRLCP
jgi:putative DNA primase/helicase